MASDAIKSPGNVPGLAIADIPIYCRMSAFGGKADMAFALRNVCL